MRVRSVGSFCSNIYVGMDRGDVMSGIDPLNMAPSHHKDDVIRKERWKQKTAALYFVLRMWRLKTSVINQR